MVLAAGIPSAASEIQNVIYFVTAYFTWLIAQEDFIVSRNAT
jgi:hypothetical protein